MNRRNGVVSAILIALSLVYGTAVNSAERTGYVEVNDTTLFYRETGSGEPVLLLHAFLLSSNLWLDQLNGLSDVCRCIAPDLRGFGQSEPISDTYLDPYKYADDMVKLLDALEVEGGVHLVGMSVGGFIAGLIYEKIPERIASLTIMSARFSWERDLIYERYQQAMARLAVVESKDAVFRRFDEYIDGPVSTLHIRARYKSMLLDTRTEMLVAFLAPTDRAKPRPDLPPMIDVPVLFPVGSEDIVLTPQMANDMISDFKDARVVIVEQAGRLLSLESPEELNKALRAFWKDASN